MDLPELEAAEPEQGTDNDEDEDEDDDDVQVCAVRTAHWRQAEFCA